MSFPKVLVISPIPFNQKTGSGVTMSNLFKEWPLASLAQIYSSQSIEVDQSVCNQYFYLPINNSGLRGKLIYKSTQLLSYLLHNNDFLKLPIPFQKLLAWCKNFNPDVIYARPSESPFIYSWLPQALANSLDIPYITRVLDDWPSRFEENTGLLSNLFWQPQLRHRLPRLFQKAAVNVGISTEMCTAFEERYCGKFIPFHNCIDASDWENIDKTYSSTEEFNLVYIGAVTEDKELESLIDICNVVISLNKRGYLLRLRIYGPSLWEKNIEKYLLHPPEVIYGGFFPSENKANILSKADLLVLPINFDQKSTAYMKYSLQTKVPEYMASGTPTLVYAPSDNPNANYAKRGGWGMVVDQKDPIILEQALLGLAKDPQLRAKLGQRARMLAFQNHNANKVRQQFQQLIEKVANKQTIGQEDCNV